MTTENQFDTDQGAVEAFSGSRRLARTYAQALLDAADQRGQTDDVEGELQALMGVFKNDPRFEVLLGSPAIDRRRKETLIQQAFEGKVGELFYNFLRVLNRRGRLDLLRTIYLAYRELRDLRANRVRVRVRAAAPLSDDQQRQLADTLRQSLGKEPVLEVKVDPDLLGGMVVQVGDEVYDTSVRTRLETIRNQLLARSSYEIQHRRDRLSSDA